MFISSLRFTQVFLISLSITCAFALDEDLGTPPPSKSILGEYKYNSVATDQVVCSQIGSYVLNVRRGNAIDAAVASTFCISVVSLHSTGISGGSFMTYYDRKLKESFTLDFRETAPQLATEKMFVDKPSTASTIGGLAIATPGQVAGLYEAWKRFGSLPWSSLVQPTEEILRKGFRVPRSLEKAIDEAVGLASRNNMTEFLKMVTNKETGKYYREGDYFTNERLADTFAKIGQNYKEFYEGSLANDIEKEISLAGGIVTKSDLIRYKPKWRTPIKFTLRDKSVLHSLPPPSSGSILALIIDIIDGYDYSSKGRKTLDDNVLYFHRLIEAYKYVYAVRAELGDEDFFDVRKIVKKIMSHELANTIRNKIDDKKTYPVNHYDIKSAFTEDHGTTHLSVVDSNGNAVSITSTINTRFGSMVVGSKTGILYNNEMDDFSTPNKTNFFGYQPSSSNFIKPLKRPMSSMSPSIVTDSDGRVKLVLGAAGGSRIITGIAQAAIDVLFFKKTIKEAIDFPRLHEQLMPDFLYYEKEFPIKILDQLAKKGHKIQPNEYVNILQGIQADGQNWFANCDVRKGGSPDGL